MIKKVYCSHCVHFLDGGDWNWCNHPNNMERVLDHKESYLSPATYKDQNIKEPSELNKHNNCPWFRKKTFIIF